MKRILFLCIVLLVLTLALAIACGDDDDDDSDGPLLDDDDDNDDDDMGDDDDDTGDDDTGDDDDDTSDDDTGDDDTGDDDTGDDDTSDDDTGDDDTGDDDTPPEIDWCNVQHPYETVTEVDVATETIYGQLWIDGFTGGGTPQPYVVAQLGYGPIDADPRTAPGQYTWTAMDFNDAHTGDNNDEYMQTLTVATGGTYAYVMRVSNDGKEWMYCDVNEGAGNGEPFSVGDMGRLYVDFDDIDWCDLQWPETITVDAGTETEAIYGQVYIEGVTGGGSPVTGLLGNVGYGPTDVDPRTWPDQFTWSNADFHQSSGNNDEYEQTLTVGGAGSYHYLYRFSDDSGATWRYCDFDPGTSNGFSLDDLGELTVNPALK